VCLKKAVFVFDAEQALIISKIDPPNVYDIVFVHPTIVAISDTRARDEVLPRNGIHALTISWDSSIWPYSWFKYFACSRQDRPDD
jgi:hypothetical protein